MAGTADIVPAAGQARVYMHCQWRGVQASAFISSNSFETAQPDTKPRYNIFNEPIV